MRKSLGAIAIAVAIMLFAPTFGTVAGAAEGTSDVYVTHGLPLDDAGTIVDVYVNGDRAIDDFAFGRTVGPLALPPGDYAVDIVAGADENNDSPLFSQTIEDLPAGGNFSVVASFSGEGAPILNVFANDTSRTAWWAGPIALHHAAAAPAVDVDLGLFPLTRYWTSFKKEIAGDVVNGDQARYTLPRWFAYTVDVRLANTQGNVLELDNVKVKRNVLTNAYVVGDPSAGTLQVITSTINL